MFAGEKKGLILVGRVVSEEPGMAICADWLKAFVLSPGPPYLCRRSLLETSLMTAGEVIERIKKNLGVTWRDSTYRDTFKFGGPDTTVTGIATTVFCSFEVLKQASAAGCNMIIPHEDTYWSDRDDVSIVSGDPLYTTKVDFMRKNNMVVFRIHDHMHAQRPDFTYVGSARDVGLDTSRNG